MALDFAVTCPLKLEGVEDAARTTLSAAMKHEERKINDRSTARRCEEHGLRLEPMVVETFGGWGPRARSVLHTIARSNATATGCSMSSAVQTLYQTLSVTLQRANAQVLLSRTAACTPVTTTLANLLNSEAALVVCSAANMADA